MSDCICAIEVAPAAPGAWRITWDESFGTGPVDVCAGPAPDRIDTTAPLARGAASGVEVQIAGARPYFELRAANGTRVVCAQRNVPLEGSINFRDCGGYAGAGGRRVRWGRLFRSGHMANLTEAGRASFAELGIRTVCDFRMHEERAAEAIALPNDPTVEVLGIPPGIGDRFFFHRLYDSTEDPAKVFAAMNDMMGALVRTGTPHMARLFEVLLAAPPGAILMNCSAGKERTGVAGILVLSALGVPRATIAHDFMLSRRYFPAESEVERVLAKYEVRKRTHEIARNLIWPMLVTDESYVHSAFAAIDAEFGSVEALLAQLYDIGPAECARLQDLYLV